MNKEEAIRMLKAKLECMTRDVSGRDSDCINRRCDECSLNYEQGNMGEQKEWLRMAIKALEPQPKERTEEGTETHACDKKGHWIYTGDDLNEGMLKCSECGFEHDVSENYSYCPDCGSYNGGAK